jgi:hypothetical protein
VQKQPAKPADFVFAFSSQTTSGSSEHPSKPASWQTIKPHLIPLLHLRFLPSSSNLKCSLNRICFLFLMATDSSVAEKNSQLSCTSSSMSHSASLTPTLKDGRRLLQPPQQLMYTGIRRLEYS